METHLAVIVHNQSPDRLFAALTEQDELAIWMDAPTLAQPKVGSMIEFQYDQGKRTMKLEVIALDTGRLVQWRVRQAPWSSEPVDHVVTWTLSHYESSTLVDFRMTDWLEGDENYASASYKWAVFMLRLRVYLGDGREIATLLPLGKQS